MLPPDLPDQLPSLTPAPPKKSRFKASRVTFEHEDAEDRMDRHDTHISAVLSRIVVSACFYHHNGKSTAYHAFPSVRSLHDITPLSDSLTCPWLKASCLSWCNPQIHFSFFCNLTNRAVTFFVLRKEIPVLLRYLYQRLQAWLSPKFCTARRQAVR